MSYFFVRFTGHVNEVLRPENFPKEVYADFIWNVKDENELRYNINEMSKVFVGQHCIVAPRNPQGVEVPGKPELDSRILVPLHMLSHISTKTKEIIGEIPTVGTDGTAQLIDGTKVRTN
jgi:hypothetical protein